MKWNRKKRNMVCVADTHDVCILDTHGVSGHMVFDGDARSVCIRDTLIVPNGCQILPNRSPRASKINPGGSQGHSNSLPGAL